MASVYERRWMQLALWVGLLWFLLGIAWAPTNKIYQQGMVLWVYLPVLIALWGYRQLLADIGREKPLFCVMVLALLLWAAVSLFWTSAAEPLRELKRILYVMLFLLLFPMIQTVNPKAIWQALGIAFVGLSLAAFWSAYRFFIDQGHAFDERLFGVGEVSHPILGAYVMVLAAIWGLQFIPRNLAGRLAWAGLLAGLIMFVVLTQSRGAGIALLACVLSMPLWSPGRQAWLVAGAAAGLALLVFFAYEPLVMARGASYRPEIFAASIKMIAQQPWLGLGVGADYRVFTDNYPEGFDHSHNLFTHAAIVLGLPGLLLWSSMWLSGMLIAWRQRATLEGRQVLGSLLVASVALQFDAASIWGSPRAEWFLTWLPVGLVLALVAKAVNVKMPAHSGKRVNDEQS